MKLKPYLPLLCAGLMLLLLGAAALDKYTIEVNSTGAIRPPFSNSFWTANTTRASNAWSQTFASSNALYLLSAGVNTESNRITSAADHSIAVSNFTYAVSNLVYVQSAGQVVLSNGVTVLSNGVATLSNSLAGLYQPLDAQLTEVAGLTMSGNAGKVVGVNAGATALELLTVSGGSGGGILLQTTNFINVTNLSTTSASYVRSTVEAGLTANLKDTGSRVRVRVYGFAGGSSTAAINFTLASWDGATEVELTPSGVNGLGAILIGGSGNYEPFSFEYVHTPGSTTPLTYRLMFKTSAGTAYLGRRGSDLLYDNATTIVVEELD